VEIERARQKPTENLQAYDYYLRSLYNTYAFTRKANIEALALCEMAITIDPNFSLAYALGANSLVQRKAFGWSADDSLEQSHARKMAVRAVELDKDDPLVLAMAGQVHSYLLGEVENGAALLKRAVALDPNLASARYWDGWAQVYLGNLDAAIRQFLLAIRLSPLDPRIFLAQTGLAFAHFFAGRYDDGLSWATLAVQQQPKFPGAHRVATWCLAMSGRVEEAKLACVPVLQTDPTLRISNIKDRTPFRRPEDIAKIVEAYRIAGVPE
jgi:tetratricopeptide (TPR) repeat protein